MKNLQRSRPVIESSAEFSKRQRQEIPRDWRNLCARQPASESPQTLGCRIRGRL